ncbi:uncharacterized protein [Antedon mediterranea]|uniref:uncharacterized protein n=1 Tax=Antedon mediterranea TaxID=105859 RepID=UPI003AF9E1E9
MSSFRPTMSQVRICLWAVPRSVSTALTVSMSNLEDVQIINQPYLSAFIVGPDSEGNLTTTLKRSLQETTDGVAMTYEGTWNSKDCSYKYMKENILEAEYPNKKVVFVKDMSLAIIKQIDMLPKGYRHAFLIRRPERVFSSLKDAHVRMDRLEDGGLIIGNGSDGVPDLYAFRESLQLYEYLIKTGIEPKPFIMDADDLLENPESILRQFCKFAGIRYTDKLLNWRRGKEVRKDWKLSKEILKWGDLGGWHKTTYGSTHFQKPSPVLQRSEISEDIQECIDFSLPFYSKLYKLRVKIN